MCTVTFIPKSNKDFILTSNRDEAPERISLPPAFYELDEVTTLFPKDVLSDGTWIGVSENKRLVCVLNGGIVRHKRQSNYKKSRGVVAKDFLKTDSIFKLIEQYDFSGIEPFTMIVVEWENDLKLYELVLDEKQQYFNELTLEPRIWSSTTLYTDAMIEERREWFKNFKSQNELKPKTILNFHKTAGKNNMDYGVIMNRGFVKTTSITQIEKQTELVKMRYENIQSNTITSQSFSFPQAVND